ncbi:MAG: hypothetical protein WCW65_00690 [Candidatus Paceibacterota bacterium]
MIIPKTEPLETQIAKARQNLREESRAAIDAVSWKLILKGINKKYTEAQLEDLEIETELLLCGLVSTVDFPRELENRMRIPRAEVSALLNEMDKLIFKKMQEELERRLSGEASKEKVLYKKKEFIADPRFVNLPKDVQEAIYYSGWKEKIYDLAKKYGINIEKTGVLEEITIKTLSGTIKTNEYETEIKSKIGLPDDKNKELVVELNEKIFKNVQELMKGGIHVEIGNEKIPAPPYIAKKGEEIPIPAPVYKEATKENSPQKEIENIILDKELSTQETDIYKESGIEIISNENKGEDSVLMHPIKKEIPVIKKETPLILEPSIQKDSFVEVVPEIKKVEEIEFASPPAMAKVPEGQRGSNIMLDKLISNTTSKTVVSDYSLPKISTQAPEKPHDPYHEAI